jgi:hypothetical protein
MEKILKEMVMIYFEALSRNFPGTEGSHITPE